jgi:hypothetical protein
MHLASTVRIPELLSSVRVLVFFQRVPLPTVYFAFNVERSTGCACQLEASRGTASWRPLVSDQHFRDRVTLTEDLVDPSSDPFIVEKRDVARPRTTISNLHDTRVPGPQTHLACCTALGSAVPVALRCGSSSVLRYRAYAVVGYRDGRERMPPRPRSTTQTPRVTANCAPTASHSRHPCRSRDAFAALVVTAARRRRAGRQPAICTFVAICLNWPRTL